MDRKSQFMNLVTGYIGTALGRLRVRVFCNELGLPDGLPVTMMKTFLTKPGNRTVIMAHCLRNGLKLTTEEYGEIINMIE